MSGITRLLWIALLLPASLLPLPAAADMSPELYQLAWETRRNFEVDSSGATRGPLCKEDCFRLANEALRDMLKREALNRVVVQPLEDGAKFALSALGAPGVAISTYNVTQCYLNEGSESGFKACLLRETIGLVGGEALQRAGGWDSLSASMAGLAWDKTFAEIKKSVDGYQARGETALHTAARDCTVNVALRWDRRRQPGANGGRIFVHITFQECRCPTTNSVNTGTLSFYVPVNLAPAGNGQPGWSAGQPQEYKLRAACCGGRRGDNRIHLYNGAFQYQGVQSDPVEEEEEQQPPPKEPEPPPTPEPQPEPEPPAPQWSEENPCPECQPFLDLALKHQAAARELETQMQETQRQLDTNRQRQQATRGRIERLEKEIAGKAGEGGRSYDPESGVTVDSWTQADGSVKVTVTDKNGNVVEERTRPRRDTAKMRRQLEQEQADLARLEAEAEALQAELARLTQGRETQLKLERDARQALADCVREKCLGGVALQDDQKPKVCTFPAVQPISIGPRDRFGEKSLEQKAQDKAKGMVGDLVGGAIGGGLGGFGGLGAPKRSTGGGGGQGPATVKDPVKDKQEFSAGSTRIKTGLAPDPKGGTRVSVDVKDSAAQGAVHTIHRETLNENCEREYQMPSDYWLYKIWLEWKLTVTWTRETYVDNQLVKRETGGWQEQGTTMLDSGIFDASKDVPFTAWGQLGFDRPFAGAREVGATFQDAQAGRPERYVIHVAEPQNDPVNTTPFVVYPVKGADGKTVFTDQQPDWGVAGGM